MARELRGLVRGCRTPDRLNRETLIQGIRDGASSPDYAREELRAEISSMMTGDRLRLGHDPSRHAAYVDFWIKALKDDPQELYRASQDAQLMSDYALNRRREKGPERESGSATERDRQARPPVPTQQHLPKQRRVFPREMEGPSSSRLPAARGNMSLRASSSIDQSPVTSFVER